MRALLLGAALCLAALPAHAQGLVPADFFNAPIVPGAPTGVEAATLTFDAATNQVQASGDVILTSSGYVVTGQTLVYDRNSGAVKMTGAVTVTDPSGNVMETTDLDLTGGMKQAFLDAITITSYDGSRITADSADYDKVLETVLTNASYAPCGDCIDDKGRRIGWSMTAAKIVQNAEDNSVYIEQPTLQLLGIPVAWLPFFYMPNLSTDALDRVPRPTYSYGDKTGHTIGVNLTAYTSKWTDIFLSPKYMSRQGLFLGAEWIQRFDNGSFNVKASGLRQGDRSAFAGTVGDIEWRGAIQTSGSFTPVENWQAGWSYVAFSDAAYIPDYELTDAKSSINQVYATHINEQTYFDIRLQQFNQLGNVTSAAQDQQGANLPVTRFEHLIDLDNDMGRLAFEGHLRSVTRKADAPVALVGNRFGYQGNKTHATLQTSWQKQFVVDGGLVFTPYLGGRADFSYYDGTSVLQPGETSLLSATPIAAMDVRYPLMASNGADVHIIEPIGQLVFRGSNTTLVGITNDDAQSFVFDDTNLFSYNRFSGYDRQETGLRANIGGRYQANFEDGSYLELVGGQSFQLAGSNAFATVDQAKTGVGGGLEKAASYAVLGAYGSLSPGLKFGGKAQVDTADWTLARFGAGASYSAEGYAASLDYRFIESNPAFGQILDQHELAGALTVPVADYWSLRANAAWDLSANSFLQVGGGVVYDDGYLTFGTNAYRNGPTHTSPNATSVLASFAIKAPAGLNIGHSGAVPVPSF
ncbi:MAG: LPS-assembly protein LptD [Proteobacteria bacterium]|nr:MAG: LPS-assembly protein LptD [Pseudomonadota bacterium]